MAIFHLHASIIGRSDGRSAVAAAAYRAGADMTDPDTGTRHDYTRKRGVRATYMEVPEAAPAWAADRPTLWAAVHAKETRKNSRLSREIRLALPAELDNAGQAELVRTWARDHLTAAGIVADIAIHEPSREGDDRNAHAHIMTTLRRFDPATADGWAKGAARDLNDKAFLEGLRASWEAAQNAALEAAGSAARVDHRSLEAQRADALAAGDDLLAAALDRPPEPHLGITAQAIDRRAGEPVSDRGRALAEVRETRSRLLQAYDHARRAAAIIADTATEAAATLTGRPARARSGTGHGDRLARMFGLGRYAATDAAPVAPAAEPPASPSPEPDDPDEPSWS